jgi:hypothetical protein
MGAYLTGVHLRRVPWACTSGVYLMGVYLIDLHPTDAIQGRYVRSHQKIHLQKK